jgi:outer membrane immunogenic protein
MIRLSTKVATSGVALMAAFAADGAQAQAPAYNWTGFYIGAHGGYGWGQSHATDAGKYKVDGTAAGLQAGYNWQFSGFVLGGEVDGSFTDIHGKSDPFFDGKGTATLSDRQRWTTTARLKAGVPINGVPLVNSMLLYGTGGVALSRWTTRLHNQGSSIGGPFDIKEKESRNHFGWVVGGGVEMPLTSSLSVKLEYLRSEFGKKKYDFNGDVFKIDHDVNSVRLGINYHFSTW